MISLTYRYLNIYIYKTITKDEGSRVSFSYSSIIPNLGPPGSKGEGQLDEQLWQKRFSVTVASTRHQPRPTLPSIELISIKTKLVEEKKVAVKSGL